MRRPSLTSSVRRDHAEITPRDHAEIRWGPADVFAPPRAGACLHACPDERPTVTSLLGVGPFSPQIADVTVAKRSAGIYVALPEAGTFVETLLCEPLLQVPRLIASLADCGVIAV